MTRRNDEETTELDRAKPGPEICSTRRMWQAGAASAIASSTVVESVASGTGYESMSVT